MQQSLDQRPIAAWWRKVSIAVLGESLAQSRPTLKLERILTRTGLAGRNNHCLRVRATGACLLSVMAFALAGCWTAPHADVQPKGDARLIQRAIPVVAVKEDATVQSIDVDQRVVVLNFSDGITATVKPGPRVKNFSRIRAGDKAKATVAQQLSVYVLKDGLSPGVDGKLEPVRTDAKVLKIEPAYRLLTLQYPNRQVEVLKVGLDAKLSEMEAGDAVVIETTELLALRVQK